MPISKYLKLIIGDKQVEVTNPEELPVSIDYALEDRDNFQNKPSAEVLALKVPATLMNSVAGNTFHNPDTQDLTEGEVFRSNQSFVIDENGFEIMQGKAFLNEATHDSRPVDYEYDLFGDNANWKIDLEETTLYDLLKHIQFDYTKAAMVASWAFDGTDPLLPYVFAPVRYRAAFGGKRINANGELEADNENTLVTYLRPSISKYWILYWALQSVGYRIRSQFLDHSFFRRQVMPWTWGNFLSSEGTKLDIHLFIAKSLKDVNFNQDGDNSLIWDLNVSNDSTLGGIDSNNDYHYDAGTKEMVWQYKPQQFGLLSATFSVTINVDAVVDMGTLFGTGEVELRIQWFRNGVQFDGGWGNYNANGNEIVNLSSGGFTAATDTALKEIFCKDVLVSDTDNGGVGTIVSGKFYLRTSRPKGGAARIMANVIQFKLDYFNTPIGGTIDFSNYIGLKKYKVLDYFRGVIDEFNLSINTDAVNKVVVIEPTHSYAVANDPKDLKPGYFVDDFIDWNKKRDLSKKWTLQNFNDYNRELTFKYKNDDNDGILKVLQDRNINILGAGKYVFPERFKTGKKEIENRFFSVSTHYEANQWNSITGISPQLVCLVPENISNTSNSEAANTFVPKSCYYKGLLTGVGGWRFDGEERSDFPFMFAVNYKDGGENDPILSYSDEKIKNGTGSVIGKGLVKRFYWQRLAIMRNGQYYDPAWFRLNNIDIANQMHREYKSFSGHRWELVQIKGYKPLQDLSTLCFLRRWAPISIDDFNNTYPSAANVLEGNSTNGFDIKYAQLKGLISDIPST